MNKYIKWDAHSDWRFTLVNFDNKQYVISIYKDNLIGKIDLVLSGNKYTLVLRDNEYIIIDK